MSNEATYNRCVKLTEMKNIQADKEKQQQRQQECKEEEQALQNKRIGDKDQFKQIANLNEGDNNAKNREIGKTIASDKYSNTIDGFWFSLVPHMTVRPFDFITVEHLQHHNKTIGMIQDLQTVVSIDDETAKPLQNNNEDIGCHYPQNSSDGITIAKVAIIANSQVQRELHVSDASMEMPVGVGKSVKFANEEEIRFALGIPEMEYPIPAGIIEMSNGLQVPISLDVSYLVGPDTAHVNASGISGNAKTSYLLFLLQSAYQKLKQYSEDYSIIIFNTKYEDLLHIDEEEEYNYKNPIRSKEKFFEILNLNLAPFNNVTYFLPRGKDGKPNSSHIPKNSKTYSYQLEDVYDKLELLFSEIYDPHYNLSSIINYIYEFWPIKKIDSNNTPKGKSHPAANSEEGEQEEQDDVTVKTWTDLFNFKDYPEEIVTHKSSLLHFQGHIQRFRRSPLFIDKKATSTYLGNEIKRIRSGHVFVIDIAMLAALEEQALVIGDVMKNIDEIYSTKTEIPSNTNITSGADDSVTSGKRPKYLLIFIDEINRFLPKSRPSDRRKSTVAEQIMKTVISGGSRGTVLFSAQQFKSSTDYTLHENTGMHITGKVGLSELSNRPYDIMDENTKMNIVRLNRGELIMVHSAFRHPIKITFPSPAFKKVKKTSS
jgi:uncharacterized protein